MSDVADLKAEVLMLRKENAKLRGERDMYRYLVSCVVHPDITDQISVENAKLWELVSDMGKMLALASWTSVENDEQASQCIYRAEALGIEVY